MAPIPRGGARLSHGLLDGVSMEELSMNGSGAVKGAGTELPPDVQFEIVRDIGNFAVALFGVSKSNGGEGLHL